MRVTVKDSDTRGVTIAGFTDQVSVTEASRGTAGTYTVVLDTEPTDSGDGRCGSGLSGELTVSPSRLFFMAGNYNTVQTVSVYAGEDLDADDDTGTLTHTVRGGDYTGVAADTVSVTVDDNDTQAA